MYFLTPKGTIRTRCTPASHAADDYFNSIKVQLEQTEAHSASCLATFQFHKGTIRTLPFALLTLGVRIFQFHKGTIRTERTKDNRNTCYHHFNSIKVQLERSTANYKAAVPLAFQFHKGTIRTLYGWGRGGICPISIP